MESPLASNGPPRYNGAAPYHTAGAHEDDFGPETDVDGEAAAHVLKALKEERNASQKGASSSEHALNLSSAGSSDSEGEEEGVEGGGWDFVKGRGKEPLPSLPTAHKVTNFDSDSEDDHKGNELEDDMNHPLNPDAAEFVPVASPVKSPTSKMPLETDTRELKHDIENGFEKKIFDIHGNGVTDSLANDTNGHGIDIHAFGKTHGLDIHDNGDQGGAEDDVHGSSVEVKPHNRCDADDEIIACSPTKPNNVNNPEEEDRFLDEIKKRPSSGFDAKENGEHHDEDDDMDGFEPLDESKAHATLGDSTINYMADLSTTLVSPHHGNLLSEDYTTSSLSPSSPHGAPDSQASNPFDTDRHETHDLDKHGGDFEGKHADLHNDFGDDAEKTIENNESNAFSSDFTGANVDLAAVERSIKAENSDEALLHGKESVDQDLEDNKDKLREEIVSHNATGEQNPFEAPKKDAFNDQIEQEDELDLKPSAPLDPADTVKADITAADPSTFDFDESHEHQGEVDNFSRPLQQEGEDVVAGFKTESAATPAIKDANSFNEFRTDFFDNTPLSLASATPLNYAEETYQSMLDFMQTPNPNERRISNEIHDAYNTVAHSLDTPAPSKPGELDLNFELSDKKDSAKEPQLDQQEESAELQPKQEIADVSHAQVKEELGDNDDKEDAKVEIIKQEHDDAVNGSYVEESNVESQQSGELETVEKPLGNDQLGSEQQARSELTGDKDQAEAETDLHQTMQTEEFEFHREGNATSASTLDETTHDDFDSFIEKQEREGNLVTFTMGKITVDDFLERHDAFVEQHAIEEENVNEIIKDINVESTEAPTHVEANVSEAVNNVSESIQEEEEEEEDFIGKKVSNLNESDVMSQSFYGSYEAEPVRSPSPEEMIDHYERAQLQQKQLAQEQLAADESSRFDSSVEATTELTPTTESTTLEAKLANENEHLAETANVETKQPEEEHVEQKTGGHLFEISHEETSLNKSAQEQFDDLTFESKTSESSFQQQAEEVVEKSSVTTLETNLDDFTSQETKIESEFLENTKDAVAKEEVSGPTSVPDVVPTPGNEDSQTPVVDLTQDITLPAGDVSAEHNEAASSVVEKQEATISEPAVEEKSDTSSTVAKAATAIGAAAVVGAAAAIAAKKTTVAAKKPTAASATKKPDVKGPISKTSTGAKPLTKTTTAAKPAAKSTATTTAAAKKPAVAAKSTLTAKPAPKPAAPKPSTTAATKPAPIRKPVASNVTKTTSTAPVPAKPAPKPAVSTAPKPKPSTTTPTKPLTNGVAKRPVTATSTAAARTSSSTVSKPAAAPSKPAAPRVPLSQRTSTSTTSSTLKKTSTSTTAPARKPLSSVTSKVGSNVTSKVGSNLKPKLGAAGTATKPSSNAIKKTEKTSSTTTKSAVTKPAKTETAASPAITETVASPVMTNGH